MLDVNTHIKRLSTLKSNRMIHESYWSDCYKFACPTRQQFLFIDKENEFKNLYDTTLIESTQLLTSSLQQGTVPANTKWFTMRVGIDDDNTSIDQGDRWLSTVSDIMFKQIHNSNFDSEVYDFLTDIVVAGWGALYIELNNNKLNFKCWPINTVYLDSHNDQQLIDCVYREYELTAEQIRNTYPDTVHESITRAKSTDKYKLIHTIYPNKEYKKSKVNIKSNKPFKSLIIDVKNKAVLEESGYDSFPVVVSRFNKNHNDLYATGQVSQVLEDSRIVNKMNRLVLNSAELTLGGVWVAKNDGVINVNNIKLRPRTIIPANTVDDIKRIDVGGNVNIGVDLITLYQNRIKRGMMSDQLTPINSSPLSATEVSARVNIIRNQLSSIFVRMQTEFLNGLLERTFDLLMRNQYLPQPPQEIINKGQGLNFTFTNPLSQSVKLESVTNINNFINTVLPLAQYNSDILDLLDMDNIVYTLQDALAVTPEALVTKEDLAQIRDAKAQAAQAQINAQQEAATNQLVAEEQQLVQNEMMTQGQ